MFLSFEFAFIIPATSPAFERTKHARLRYVLTATALGAGRGGKGDVSTHQDVFVIVQVQPDGGPTSLDLQYQDVHQALGPISVALISASLTVGGTASVQIHHPDPAPGLSVHVVRVFLEQTMELYSSQRRAWLKLPSEKLRLWEKGCMPYRSSPQDDVTIGDTIWFAQTTPDGVPVAGQPGCGAGDGRPNMSPFGSALTGTFAHHCPAGPPQLPATSRSSTHGYNIKSILRLPDHRVIRPSTVRGSQTDIRVTHEVGVEVFFSRLSVLDDRPQSESFGLPKVQVFSMRRAIAIPSCACTHDTIHLPPYSLESPIQSRPPSPHNNASHPALLTVTSTAPGTPGGPLAGPHPHGVQWRSELLDMRSSAVPTAYASPAASRPGSRPASRSASRAGSRDPSPEREGRTLRAGIAAALKSGRRSRHASPDRLTSTAGSASAGACSSPGSGSNSNSGSGSDIRRPIKSGLRPFKVAHSERASAVPSSPALSVPRKLSKSKSSQSLRPLTTAKAAASGVPLGPGTPTNVPKQRPALLSRHSYAIPTAAAGVSPGQGHATPKGGGKQRPALLTRHSYHTAPRAVFGLLTTNKPPDASRQQASSPSEEPDEEAPAPPWSHPPFYTGPTNTSRARCTCGRDS